MNGPDIVKILPMPMLRVSHVQAACAALECLSGLTLLPGWIGSRVSDVDRHIKQCAEGRCAASSIARHIPRLAVGVLFVRQALFVTQAPA